MKKFKKLLLNISAIGIIASPIAAVISCGSDENNNDNNDQNKMDGITADMVKTALNIIPDANVLPSTVTLPTTPKSTTLNNLADVQITISSWVPDDPSGKINATMAVSKKGLTPPTDNPFSIEWTGYSNTIIINNANINQYATFTSGNLVIKNEVYIIGDTIDWTKVTGVSDLTDITTLTLPSNLIGIDSFAFSSITGVTNLDIPNSVTSIGNNAFENSQLTQLTIPNSVTSIGYGAFYSSPLTSLTLGNSVTTIDDSAFENSQLTSLTIPNSVTYIGEYAFYSSPLTSLVIPNSVTTIGENTFYSVKNETTTNVTMPSKFSNVKNYLFPNGWSKIHFTLT